MENTQIPPFASKSPKINVWQHFVRFDDMIPKVWSNYKILMKPENLGTTLIDMTGICVGWYWSHIKPLNHMSCQLN